MSYEFVTRRGSISAIGEDGRVSVVFDDDGSEMHCGVDRGIKRWKVTLIVGDPVSVQYPSSAPERARIVLRHLER